MVRAGSANSFAEAEEDLLEYRGLKISHMTIREICQQEAVKMEEWQKTASSEIAKDFVAASGNVEVTMDGTSVNTTEGYKEVKIVLNSKRELAESALPEEWDKRKLPGHTARVASAAIEYTHPRFALPESPLAFCNVSTTIPAWLAYRGIRHLYRRLSMNSSTIGKFWILKRSTNLRRNRSKLMF